MFVVTLAIYVLMTTYTLRFIEPPTGDQPHYLLETISLLDDGDLDLRNNYTTDESFGQFSSPGRQRGGFRGIPVSYRLHPDGHIVVRTTGAGEVWYPKHNAGLPILLIPGWLFGKAAEPTMLLLTADGGAGWPGTVLQMNVIGALLATQVFLLAWDVARSRSVAWAICIALSCSVPLAIVTMLLFAETPGALATIYAFRHLMRLTLPRAHWRVALVSFAIGALPWLNPRFLLFAACLSLLAAASVWRLVRADEQASGTTLAARAMLHWRTLVLLGSPMLLSALGTIWYHQTYFGSPLGISDQYEGFFVPTFEGGQLGADWLALLLATLGVLFDRQFGLLTFAPVYILAAVGMTALWRDAEQRVLVLTLAVVAIPYAALTADFRVWWGGWSPPARYLSALAPLMALPLAASLIALHGVRWYRLLFGALAGLGLMLMIGFVAQLGAADIPQGIFTNPTRNPPIWRWIDARFGLDLTRYLPALAPWFGNRRLPIPWTEVLLLLTASTLVVGLSIRAVLQRSSALRERGAS